MSRRSPRRASIVVGLFAVVALLIPAVADAQFSGSNGRIYFSRDLHSVLAIDADGSNASTVISDPTIGYQQAVPSPNGKQIAYVSTADGANDIWVAKADGSGAQNLTNFTTNADGLSPAFAQNPSWTPDGSQVVFDNQRGLHSVPANGGSITTLLTAPLSTTVFFPSVSPDGTRIAYTASPDFSGNAQLMVFTIGNSAAAQPLTNLQPNTYDLQPDWRPDGNSILFTRFVNGVGSDLFTIDPAAPFSEQNLTGAISQAVDSGVWSPDATHIVARVNGDDIGVLPADGSSLNVITSGSPFDFAPYWSVAAAASGSSVRASLTLPASAPAGQPVSVTLHITNDGSVPLTWTGNSFTPGCLTDTFDRADGDNTLTVGEIWTITCTFTPTTNPQQLRAEVDFLDPDGNPVSDVDVASMSIDSSGGTGPSIHAHVTSDVPKAHVGDLVTGTLAATNDGNVPLVGVSPTSGFCTSAPTGPTGDVNTNGMLDVGETWSFSCGHTVTGADGSTLTVQASVSAIPFGGGSAVSDSDSASVAILHPAIQVTITAPASVNQGGQIHIAVDITNPGDTPLANLSGGNGPSCLTAFPADPDNNGVLEVGETWHGECDFTQALDPQTYYVSVDARDELGGLARNDDTAFITVISGVPHPALTTTALADVSQAHVGDTVHLGVRVKNDGDVGFANVIANMTVCDSPLNGPTGDNGNGLLDPGETWNYTCDHVILEQDGSALSAQAEAHGTTAGGVTLSTADRATVAILHPAIRVVVSAPATVGQGQVVHGTADITNTGDTPLQLTAADAIPPCSTSSLSGDDGNGRIDPGEVWHASCDFTPTSDPQTWTGRVTGVDALGRSVSDNDDTVIDVLGNGTGGTSLDSASNTNAAPGEAVTTNTTTSANDPVGTSVQSPAGGSISIVETEVPTTPAPSGISFLGWQVNINIPPGAPGSATNPLEPTNPLRITFYVDVSLSGRGGYIYRDGVPFPMPANCTTPGVASPEPCVETSSFDGQTLKVVVLAVHASAWNFSAADNTGAPSVTLTRPAQDARYTLGQNVTASYSCVGTAQVDPVSCLGTVPNGSAIPTDYNALGAHVFTVNSTGSGGTTSVSHDYSVVFGFEGFGAPVDARPTLNVVKPGSAVPIKFKLKNASGGSAYGVAGLNVFAADNPRSAAINCSSGVATDPIEETSTATKSGLSYDSTAQQYVYTWKTDKTWAVGSCRRLLLTLKDGETYSADFKFK